jgi:hypothetical protein
MAVRVASTTAPYGQRGAAACDLLHRTMTAFKAELLRSPASGHFSSVRPHQLPKARSTAYPFA